MKPHPGDSPPPAGNVRPEDCAAHVVRPKQPVKKPQR
jgi:hypothetical protein